MVTNAISINMNEGENWAIVCLILTLVFVTWNIVMTAEGLFFSNIYLSDTNQITTKGKITTCCTLLQDFFETLGRQ